jgi:ubiquinone/menaquinone biosynthesis C-methylase UbiE
MESKNHKNIERQKEERAFWDRFAHRYDRFMKRRERGYDILLEKIENYLDKSAIVLEIATGTGSVALRIFPKVKKVYACDISSEMIKVAKAKKEILETDSVEFSVQDAYYLEFKNNFFDIVIIVNALHIMTDPERVLKSIDKVLKPGGIFISATYCHGNSILARTISGLMSLAGFKAYSKWSIDSYRTFLESNGFDIESFEIIKDAIPLAFTVSKIK